MVRVSSPAKLRPWSELTAKMVMGVLPGLVIKDPESPFLKLKGAAFNLAARAIRNTIRASHSSEVI